MKVGRTPPWLHHNPCCPAKIYGPTFTQCPLTYYSYVRNNILYAEQNLHHRGTDRYIHIEREKERKRRKG
ncbi:hypothetical protein HanIR_Chr09g0402361 [Helianthus annuus]|nr:hypothetical protein HanIR_Chr09g0402361 [Helianthus annuus]